MEKQNRRSFFKSAGLLTAAITGVSTKTAKASPENILSEDRMGVLVDTTVCIGCRNCEWACKKAHDLTCGRFRIAMRINLFLKKCAARINQH